MRFAYPLMLLMVAPAIVCAQPQAPLMEALVLADGDSGSVWQIAEATMEPDATHSRDGRALRFHIDVDHETGEPNYPIGWPRTFMAMPEELRDWSGWDFIEFWLYAETSRESLPPSPLGFIVRCPDRNSSFSVTLSEATKDDWAHFRFPISSLPNPADCTAVQFFIAESNYRHGDVLDFWIDDLALLRYAEPTILTMRPLSGLHYADADAIHVEIELTGMAEDESAEVLARLVTDGATVRQGSARLGSGPHTIPLSVGGGLPPGEYEVQAQIRAGPDPERHRCA
jgi:hypothetical protein